MFSVIFDMDGTLLDTQKICIPAWDYAGELQGFKNLGKHIPEVCGMNQTGWTNFLKSRYKTLNIENFVTEQRRYAYENGEIKYKKGALELLNFLKQNNIKMGLASGSSRNSVDHHLNKLDAFKYFDATVAGKEVENGKPAPDIFLLTAEKMGVLPNSCFVFEDSPNGIKAGYNAGMKCIGVPDIAPFSDEIRKLMFSELEDLSQAIAVFKNYL